MADQRPGERLLAGFLRAVLDAEFSASERRAAAEAIRSGQLIECILNYLDYGEQQPTAAGPKPPVKSQVSPQDIKVPNASERRMNALSVDTVFETLRRRKISKVNLVKMLEHLNTGLELDVDDVTPMRELLRQFKDKATEVEWLTLYKMISGEVETDSYLRNILRS